MKSSRNEELKNGILNNFDHYEKYLYFESSSLKSSSFGPQFDDSISFSQIPKPHSPSSAHLSYNLV